MYLSYDFFRGKGTIISTHLVIQNLETKEYSLTKNIDYKAIIADFNDNIFISIKTEN